MILSADKSSRPYRSKPVMLVFLQVLTLVVRSTL